jgi:uncharacterized membrane protein YeaQ/YmgE (transglycosylase-associated protein family)
MQFLLWIVVGLAGGWMAGKNMRGYGYGPLMDSVMGVAGGLAGGFITRVAALSGYNAALLSLLGAGAGAIALTALTGLTAGRQRYA